MPSPSKSTIADDPGTDPVVNANGPCKELVSNVAGLPNVGLNGTADEPISPFAVTVIGANVAPLGTVTDRLDEEPVCTFAWTAPNHTALAEAFEPKFCPAIVMASPIVPDDGEIVVIWGTCADARFTLSAQTNALTPEIVLQNSSEVLVFIFVWPSLPGALSLICNRMRYAHNMSIEYFEFKRFAQPKILQLCQPSDNSL